MASHGQVPGDAGVLTTTYDQFFAQARRAALRPLRLGLACCAVEWVAALDPRHERLGSDALRTTPGQSDLLIVSGTIAEKAADLVRRIWEQMPPPKWVIALGACASCGGPYPTYAVTQGIDRVLPVDVYVPGCPPPAEALLLALLHLDRKIARQRSAAAPAAAGPAGGADPAAGE
jgi:NADH-quinone oxidoreductase subunit B